MPVNRKTILLVLSLFAAALLMAQSGVKIRNLPLDAAPADTDEIAVAKVAGLVTKKTTRADLRAGLAPTTRTISTTAPLTGGGTLAADRAFALSLTSLGGLTAASGSLGFERTATLAADPALAANGSVFSTTGLLFEGATANGFEGLLVPADPAADRTWTLPDASGSLVTTGDSDTVTGTMIAAAYAGRSLTETTNVLNADAELYTRVVCDTFNSPTNGQTALLFRTPLAITATRVDCLVTAATSAVAMIQVCTANGASCSDLNTALTCTTTNTAAAPPTVTAISAGAWLRTSLGATVGSPTQLSICLTYTVDD